MITHSVFPIALCGNGSRYPHCTMDLRVSAVQPPEGVSLFTKYESRHALSGDKILN